MVSLDWSQKVDINHRSTFLELFVSFLRSKNPRNGHWRCDKLRFSHWMPQSKIEIAGILCRQGTGMRCGNPQ